MEDLSLGTLRNRPKRGTPHFCRCSAGVIGVSQILKYSVEYLSVLGSCTYLHSCQEDMRVFQSYSLVII